MVFSEADEKRLEALKVSLEQARAGTHSRIVQEEKRLRSVKGSKFGKVESLRDFRLAIVQVPGWWRGLERAHSGCHARPSLSAPHAPVATDHL